MALEAGIMSITLEYAKGLKDCDWFGKQDPYVILKCGGQTVRSRTCVDGGRNPVWGETFQFNVINENSAEIKIMDEDNLSRDDLIGECIVSLAKAREQGADSIQVPVMSPKSKKQRGFLSVKVAFQPNKAVKRMASLKQSAPVPPAPQQPLMMHAYPQQYAMPPMGYAPMPGYAPYPAAPYAAAPYAAAPYPCPAAPYAPCPAAPYPAAPYPYQHAYPQQYAAATPAPTPQPVHVSTRQ